MSASVELEIEQGRYQGLPEHERICKYCSTGEVDHERHLLLHCPTFLTSRLCFIGKMSSLIPNFRNMSEDNQLTTMLCPVTAATTRLINKYIRLLFANRRRINNGDIIISYPTYPTNINCDAYFDYLDLDFDYATPHFVLMKIK